jgi:type II secretory ATPase GspE/PulE/Tfp pilus assembly ATPase PilB-like protein
LIDIVTGEASMIFGFGKSRANDDDEDDDEDDEEEVDLVNFQGALNGRSADLAANARLVQAALLPTREMITDALERRAEMIRLEIKGEKAQTALSVDGMPFAGSRMPKQQAVAVIQMLKILSGLDAKLKGKHQVGGVKAEFNEIKYELTTEIAPQADGSERLTVRIRNMKHKLDTPQELGFTDASRATIRQLTSNRHGIIVSCGPAGSGVTTTLYALVRGIDVYLYSIYSVADPGSRELINIGRMMREEADVVLVKPIRDADTTKQLMNVADRITIMSEMTAKDAANGIWQLAEWSGNRELASTVIDAAYGTKLIRILCTSCREAFRPNPKLLEKVGLPPETKVLYRKGEPMVDEKTGEEDPPCEKCDGIGYYGRVAMIETIVVSDTLRKLIASGATADQIKVAARSEGCLTFHKDGLRLVAEGKTSLEELQRVFKA